MDISMEILYIVCIEMVDYLMDYVMVYMYNDVCICLIGFTLWQPCKKTMENHTFYSWVNQRFLWPFSLSLCNKLPEGNVRPW